MGKLLKFFVELCLVGILVAWLVVRYPKLIDNVIPTIVLLILWYLTWEHILQWRPVKAAAVAFGKRCKPMLAWPLVFVAGGLISILYWYGINRSIQGLAALEATREASKKSSQQGPTESKGAIEAAPKAQAPPATIPAPHGPAAPKLVAKPKGPRLGIGPEAYGDLTDEQVGRWAMEEADKIKELANRATKDFGHGFSADAIIWSFTTQFNDCCAGDLKELRAEVLRRLGPPGKDPDEISAWIEMFPEVKYPVVSDRINPVLVREYAPHLRRLGLKLKRRAVPKSAPAPLHFSEKQLDVESSLTSPTSVVLNTDQFGATAKEHFPFRIMVTINAEGQFSAGFIVVEFNNRFAGAECDFVDSKSVLDVDLADNRELPDYLASHQGTTYGVAIGKTPFGPEKSIHVVAFGRNPLHVVKATWFDE